MIIFRKSKGGPFTNFASGFFLEHLSRKGTDPGRIKVIGFLGPRKEGRLFDERRLTRFRNEYYG